MTAHALSLVPLEASREPEQLLLRPVLVFARELLDEPWEVAMDRRRPPVRKACAAVRVEPVPVEAPDLWSWKPRPPRRPPKLRPKRAPATPAPPAPIRPAGLRVVAPPRKELPGARPRSLGLSPLTQGEKAALRIEEAWQRRHGLARPAGEGDADCENLAVPGPCPFAGCPQHLATDVDETTGALKLNFPDREVWELAETCAIRVARERGALSQEEVGKLINVTDEWVRQIEVGALRKLKRWAKGARR